MWFSVHGYIVVVYRSSANFLAITCIQNVIVVPYTMYISLYHVGLICTIYAVLFMCGSLRLTPNV